MWRYLPFLLMVIGATLVHFYLYSLESSFPFHVALLFFGVFLQSTAILVFSLPLLIDPQRRVSSYSFIICTLVLSFSVAYMPTTRFALPWGSDIPFEVRVALATSLNNHWDTNFIAVHFWGYEPLGTPIRWVTTPWGIEARGFWGISVMNTLSVSIFPLILSELTGMSILSVFHLLMPAIVALIPLFSFILVRSFLGDTPVTYLSVAMIPQVLFFLQIFLGAVRAAIAVIFLFLLLACLVKGTRKHLLLASIFSLGTTWAHYTVSYIGLFIILSYILVPRLYHHAFKRLMHASVSEGRQVGSLVFAIGHIAMMIAWMLFFGVNSLAHHAWNVKLFLEAWIRLSFESRPENLYVFGSPRGAILTIWFDLQFALMGVGGLVALYDCIRGKITRRREVSWGLVGCSLIGLILAMEILPKATILLPELPRLIAYLLPWLCVSMATVFIRVRKRPAILLVAVFLLLMLPMNMCLPDHGRDAMYHPLSTLSIDRQINYYSFAVSRSSDYIVAQSISGYLSSGDRIAVDSVGKRFLLWSHVPWSDLLTATYPTIVPGPVANHLLLHELYLKYGVWGRSYLGEVMIKPTIEITPNELLSDPSEVPVAVRRYHPSLVLDVTYSSGTFIILSGK